MEKSRRGRKKRSPSPPRSVEGEKEDLGQSIVVDAVEEPKGTIIFLHGFGLTAKKCAARWSMRIKKRIKGAEDLRFVFLQAPKRKISCHHDSLEPSWHDYLSNHGSEIEQKAHIEEVIDAKQLFQIRTKIHQAISTEAEAYYQGDTRKIALLGDSQGGCVALDVFLTFVADSQMYPLAGVWASSAHLYTATPLDNEYSTANICAYHGSKDDIIAPSLALRSYARLLKAGAHHFSLHLEANLNHCQKSDNELSLLAKALYDWNLLSFEKNHNTDKKNEESKTHQPKINGHDKEQTKKNKKKEAILPAPVIPVQDSTDSFPCQTCHRTDLNLFSKSQLMKGPLRRCTQCIANNFTTRAPAPKVIVPVLTPPPPQRRRRRNGENKQKKKSISSQRMVYNGT